MAKKDTEIYCKMMAKGADYIDALAAAGYKVDNEDSARRQKRNLDKNSKIQSRIKELVAYYKENPERKDAPIDAMTPAPTPGGKMSAREYLESVINDIEQDQKSRIQAAVALLPYEEAKIAPKGKKEGAKDTAKQATTSGKFATLGNQAEFLGTMN